MPLGIPAIVFAAQVNSKAHRVTSKGHWNHRVEHRCGLGGVSVWGLCLLFFTQYSGLQRNQQTTNF